MSLTKILTNWTLNPGINVIVVVVGLWHGSEFLFHQNTLFWFLNHAQIVTPTHPHLHPHPHPHPSRSIIGYWVGSTGFFLIILFLSFQYCWSSSVWASMAAREADDPRHMPPQCWCAERSWPLWEDLLVSLTFLITEQASWRHALLWICMWRHGLPCLTVSVWVWAYILWHICAYMKNICSCYVGATFAIC